MPYTVHLLRNGESVLSAVMDTRARTRQAAHELLARGEEPTVRKVRQIIGGGSFSTISDELEKITAEKSEEPVQAPNSSTSPQPFTGTPPLGYAPPDNTEVLSELSRLSGLVVKLTSELARVHEEMAELRRSSEEQLKVAYERYGAVQKQALMQIDAARMDSAELREKLRNMSGDAQLREDAQKSRAQHFQNENQKLLGRIEELTLRNAELTRLLKSPQPTQSTQPARPASSSLPSQESSAGRYSE